MDLFKLVAKLGMDSSEYERGISKARGSFSELGNQISAKAVAMGNMIAHAMEKAVNVAVDLGKSAVQNAADVTAEKAQFKATFGTMQGEAEKAFAAIEKETGIFGTRLQKVGTKAFSQFAGAGIKGADGLAAMEEHTKLAADAAAYYDISLEDADARLRSFLRGNTEAGDAIGLFTSESQRNSAAMEKYGQKWQKLTEAQKQMLMLDISKDIYKQSGAIGQAARESDAWTNVVGNLKEAWRQATALIGAPIMSALTPVIQELAGFLNDEQTQTMLTRFGLTLVNIGKLTFDGVKSFIDKMLTAGTGENTMMSGMGDFAVSLKNIAGLVFDKVTGFLEMLIGGPDGMSDTMGNIGAFFSDVGAFIDTYKEPISTLIAAIMGFWAVTNPFALVLGALALLITNWKDVKRWTEESWKKFQDYINTKVPEGFLSAAISAWQSILGLIQSAQQAANAFIESLSGASAAAGAAAIQEGASSGGVSGALSAAWDSAWYNPKNWGSSDGFGGGTGGGTGGGKGFATGLDYVPYNNFFARLHEGEAVLTKIEAEQWRRGTQGAADASGIASAVASAVSSALDGAFVDMDGEHVGRLVTKTVSRNIAQDARGRRYVYG